MAKKRGDIYSFTKMTATVDEQLDWLLKRKEI